MIQVRRHFVISTRFIPDVETQGWAREGAVSYKYVGMNGPNMLVFEMVAQQYGAYFYYLSEIKYFCTLAGNWACLLPLTSPTFKDLPTWKPHLVIRDV